MWQSGFCYTILSSGAVCTVRFLLAEVNAKLNSVLAETAAVKENQCQILQSLENLAGRSRTADFDFEMFHLPIDSDEDLSKLAVDLADKQKKKILVGASNCHFIGVNLLLAKHCNCVKVCNKCV